MADMSRSLFTFPTGFDPRSGPVVDEAAGGLALRALSVLGAGACVVDASGHLIWADEAAAAKAMGFLGVPGTLAALDACTDGAVSRAMELGVSRTGPYGGLEVRCDPARGLLTIRSLAPNSGETRREDPQARALEAALTDQRIALFRQPIVTATDAAIVRWECLARVIGEDGAIMSPASFIPAAERAGLVGALDLAALELALHDLAADPGLNLAVNVSAGTIADEGACQAYAERLAAGRDLTARLTVEITETIAIHDLDTAARFGHLAHAAGARLALDDFGEGYTSFRALRALPLDEVKIDGLYVESIDTRADSRAFVRAIDRLARDLGLETVAERVETEGEALALRELGVGGLQGFLYGRPQAAH
jgi:EAL domain-containing protein (putative c-di-GMP-specific phosphodiesterase class I)